MESRPYRSRPQNWAWCDVISRFNAREARYLVRICPYINDKNYDYCRVTPVRVSRVQRNDSLDNMGVV